MPSKPRRKKSTKRRSLFVPLLLLLLIIAALVASYILLTQPQDIREQASGCSEAPVNVQFRKYTGQETIWLSGDTLQVEVGDAIDVNCFSKNGTSLLSGGVITAKLDGVSLNVASNYKTNQEIRNYSIVESGTYVFTCQNSSSCSDSDSFTVEATTDETDQEDEDTSTDYTGSTETTCTEYSEADFNQDCIVDLDDYQFFLTAFIEDQSI